jgi:hypothetical protein
MAFGFFCSPHIGDNMRMKAEESFLKCEKSESVRMLKIRDGRKQ